MRVKVFVVAHKPAAILQGGVLVPIHVGRAVSPFAEEMGGYIGDDTGENISGKNPQYCEMTAHYWIWKNICDTEYVGVCHYRRYFGVEMTQDNIGRMMAGYDVMLVEPSFHIDSVYAYFAKFVGAENMTILAKVMEKVCPDYVDTLESLCDGVKFYPFNMLLCRKPLFDMYCEWMFGILEECERYVKPAPYTNAGRALAYMAEMLTSVFFVHRRLRIRAVPYMKVEDERRTLVKRSEEESESLAMYESLLRHELAWKVREDRQEKFRNPAILLGLRHDGIEI